MRDDRVAAFFQSLQRKPNVVSGHVTAVTGDPTTGEQRQATVAIGSSTIAVPLDALAPRLAMGDQVRLEQYGQAAAAEYRLAGLEAGTRPGAGLYTVLDNNIPLGGALYAGGDVIFGKLAGGNIFVEHATGRVYRRIALDVYGIEYPNGSQLFGHAALDGGDYAADGPNVLIESTGIKLRNATAAAITLDTSGVVWAGKTLRAGAGNTTVALNAEDATWRLYVGHATPASAPFRVDKNGVLNATGATITGNVTATSGTIGGWALGETTLTGGSATLGSTGYITLGTSNNIVRLDANDAGYRLWIGHATAASAPFRVTPGGLLTATGVTISGAITPGIGSVVDGQYIMPRTVTASALTITAGGANLLRNSSFEVDSDANGIGDGWTRYNPNQATEPVTMSIVATGGIDGRAFQRLTWDVISTNSRGIYTTSATSGGGVAGGWRPDTTYFVSFWARANLVGAASKISLSSLGSPVIEYVVWPTLSTAWQQYVIRYTTTAAPVANGALYLMTSVQGNTGTLDFDHVQVEQADTASAWKPFPSELEPGSVTADKISVTSLSALSANMGDITAGDIVIGSTNKIWLNDANDGALNIGGATKGSAPFQVTAAGILTATGATISGALTSTSGTIGGWTLGATTLTGGNATLNNTGYITLGTSNDIARLDAADATYRLWIGNATAASAPFRVTKGGVLTATNANITGAITATSGSFTGAITSSSGTIGGWVLSADALTDVDGMMGLTSYISTGDNTRLWAGATYANRGSAPFRVTEAGILVATSGTIGGWTLGATSLVAGSGSNTVGLDSGGTNPALYAGSATPASAPFRVTKAGVLTAVGVDITGKLTLGAGSVVDGQYITNDSIAATALSITAGGANLITNSSFQVDVNSNNVGDGWGIYNNSVGLQPHVASIEVTGGVDGRAFQRITWDIANTSTKGVLRATDTVHAWLPNTTYVVSFWAKAALTGPTPGMVLAWNTHPATTTTLSNPNLTTSWQRYAFRIIWGASVEGGGRLYISIGVGLSYGTLDIDHVQVEQSDVVSAWKPYPSELEPGSVTADKISVTNLSALSADMGSLTAGSIVLGSTNKLWLNDAADGALNIGGATKASAPFRVTAAGVLTATSGTVGGWTLGATSLDAGSGNSTVGLDSGGTNPAFYAGSATPGSAPFRVTKAGVLTATSGTVGGWVLGVDSLTDTDDQMGLTSYVSTGDNTRIWAGATYANRTSAPFRVTESGALVATTGYIGGTSGWTIAAGKLTSTGIGIATAAGDATYAFWAGSDTPANAEFRVTHAGALNATGATISGEITASSGSITGSLYVGAADPRIHIDGANKRIESTNYASGTSGFRQDGVTGDAEFNNITARGALKVTTLQYGQVLATNGSIWVTPDAGRIIMDVTSVDSPTTFYIRVEDPDGLTHAAAGGLWAVNDLVRLKEPLTGDLWCKISAKTDMTTYWRLTVTKQSPGAGTNYTFKTGCAVLNYGQSGAGMIRITADAADSPYISIATHAGSPWSALTERARLGNLTGISGASGYGLWTDNGFFTGVVTANTGKIGGASGWTIAAGKLTSTGIGLATAEGDATYAFWAGDDTPASAEFRVTHAGVLTATGATISGTLTATSGTIGGWTLGATTLTGGNATLSNTGYITLGTSNDIARLDAADATYRLWIGNAAAASAPFRVTKAGVLTATGVTVSGALTLGAGSVVHGQYISTGTVTASALSIIAGGANLLANSSFQIDTNANGLADGWTVYNNSVATEPHVASLPATGGVDNRAYQRITWTVANTTSKGMYRPMAWKINTTYVVSFWARLTGSSLPTMVLVWGGTTPTVTTLKNPALTGTWQYYAFRVSVGGTAPTGTVYISISYANPVASGVLDIDHAQVEEADTPSAWKPYPSELEPGSVTASIIDVATLSAMSADMGSLTAGSIVIGSTNKLWLNDAADGALNIGGATKASAPFRVTAAGALTATTATITGVVTANTGSIGGASGWVIAAGKLTSTGIGLATAAGDATYAFWAGSDTPASAEFRVSHAGVLTAVGVDISGKLTLGAGSVVDGQYISTGTVTATALSILAGGANLVRNSSFEINVDAGTTFADGWAYYNPQQATEPMTGSVQATGGVDGRAFQRVSWAVANTGYKGMVASNTTGSGVEGGWIGNTTYVVSFWAKGSITGATPTMRLQIGGWTSQAWTARPDLTTAWQRYEVRVVTAASPTASGLLYIVLENSTGAIGSFDVDHVQVERADVASAWKPFPSELEPGSVTASKISVTNLSTLSADMGSLTAGNIVIGSTNKLWLNDAADGALNIGGATKASAPFRVTAAGVLTATSGTVGGWTLGATTLTGGNATLSNTGYITLGTSNDIARLDAADATYRLWIGNATAASAPFSVTKAGALTALSGTVGGWTLAVDGLKSGTGANTVGLDSTGGANPAIWAGNATASLAPFRVTAGGVLTALNADIAGIVNATSGSFTGTITSTSGSIGGWALAAETLTATRMVLNAAGAITAGSGNNAVYINGNHASHLIWAGHTNPASASFNITNAGILTATGATISGNLYAETGQIGGWTVTANLLKAGMDANTVGLDSGGTNPAIWAGHATPTSAPFQVSKTGALTATIATITGAITASSGSLTGFLTLGSSGGIYQGTYQSGYSGNPAYPDTGLKIWNASGKGRIAGYNGGTEQWSADTNGYLTAAAGNIKLNANGISVTSASSTKYLQLYNSSISLNPAPVGYLNMDLADPHGYNNGTAVFGYERDSNNQSNVYCYLDAVSVAVKKGGTWKYVLDANYDVVAVKPPLRLETQSANPSAANGYNAQMYLKGTKLIIQYYDTAAAVTRYKYMELTGTGASWTHTTTAP